MLKEIATGNVLSQSYQSSTVKSINDATDYLLAPLIVMSFGLDNDRDGVFEQWNITTQLRLPTGMMLSNLNLIAAFDYQTTKEINMQMEALAHIQINQYQSTPVRSIKTIGTLELAQLSALVDGVAPDSKRKEYNVNFFDNLAYSSASELLADYGTHNETTHYKLIGRPIQLYG